MFGPGDISAWDGVHVGVSDVVRDAGELVMFYFGGSDEKINMGPPGQGDGIAGFRMRIGRAVSTDGGMTWRRDSEPVLDINPEEGLFASWPRILSPELTGGPWRMLYHAFNGSHWRAPHKNAICTLSRRIPE